MKPLDDIYTSPDTYAVYPTAWQIAVPSLGLGLRVKTPLASQEPVSGIGPDLSCWEGAIVINGTRNGKAAKRVGYLEMTGYARPVPSHQ